MIYKYILIFFILDSILPIFTFIRSYYLGKYVIKNKLNRMYINNLYLSNNILNSKIKFPFINNGFIFFLLYFIPYHILIYTYFKNDDYNTYFLNNIQKHFKLYQSLYSWSKLGYNIGQLIQYNK